MKQSKLLLGLIGICLLFGFSSCEGEDKSVFGDDFEIPELTDANTIQFTVDVTGVWKALQIIVGGGRMAVEWGDGRLQKVENTDANPVIHYKYGNSKTYRVRIWAEELEFCSVGNEATPFSDLRLGYLPKMKTLNLNSFLDTPELDLSTSCPNVETINIGNWADLERIDLSQCVKIQTIDVYSNPELTLLKLGQLPALRSLKCIFNDALVSLSFKGLTNLSDVQCGSNPQLSIIETGEKINVRSLSIGDCAFRSLEFINSFPLLQELSCSSNNLTSLDLSELPLLRSVDCSDNKKLVHLQIPEQNSVNPILQNLDCSFCYLDEKELNAIFCVLPVAPNPYPEYPSGYGITFNGNPGSENCDRKLVEDKGWNIFVNPEDLINR